MSVCPLWIPTLFMKLWEVVEYTPAKVRSHKMHKKYDLYIFKKERNIFPGGTAINIININIFYKYYFIIIHRIWWLKRDVINIKYMNIIYKY